MILPIDNNVKLPSDLIGIANGAVPVELQTNCGVGKFTMHHIASRCMKALLSKCPYPVGATGTGRTYQQQVDLFQARYTTTVLPNRPIKIWNGVKYYQKPNTAMAAVPGTSNHGYWLAIDFATNTLNYSKLVEWLIIEGPKFGFYGSTQSESWHWQYVLGDNVPQIVLDYEKPPVGSTVSEIDMKPRLIRQNGFLNVFYVENANVITLSPNLLDSYLKEEPGLEKIFQDHMESFRSFAEKAGLAMGDWKSGGPSDVF